MNSQIIVYNVNKVLDICRRELQGMNSGLSNCVDSYGYEEYRVGKLEV